MVCLLFTTSCSNASYGVAFTKPACFFSTQETNWVANRASYRFNLSRKKIQATSGHASLRRVPCYGFAVTDLKLLREQTPHAN
jgi:hypothetical protein